MNKTWMLLSIVAFFALTACGGGGGPGPTENKSKISGNINPPIAAAKICLTHTNGPLVACITDGTDGHYSFSNLASDDYVITTTHANYTFSPPSYALKLTGGDYPRVDFAATPTPSGGVAFSGTLGGYNSVADTHYDSVSGTFVAGGQTNTYGSSYGWYNADGAGAGLSYSGIQGILAFGGFGPNGSANYNVVCWVNVVLYGSYPLCSNAGVTFDHTTGIITFTSTPIMYYGTTTPTGITATGSLTFQPF